MNKHGHRGSQLNSSSVNVRLICFYICQYHRQNRHFVRFCWITLLLC